MIYTENRTREISFPLGGIGSGSVGLAGNGRLCDWEIFNRSNKNSFLGYTHFCIRTGTSFRLLQGDCFEPYTGTYRSGDGTDRFSRGFGWGVEGELLPGLPHFRDVIFDGRFPTAELRFSDDTFPIRADLTAWSPFIPGCDRISSLPCAVLEYTFTNTTGEPLEATAVGVLANPWQDAGHFNQVIREDDHTTLKLSGGTENELSLTLLAAADDVSSQEYWYRGGWQDHLEMYLNDLQKGGRFTPRTYPVAPERTRQDHGLLAEHFTLPAGGSRRVTFLLTWHIPERSNTWNHSAKEYAEQQNIPLTWRNYYATQWKDSGASANELRERIGELRAGTMRFRDSLFASTLPDAVLDGASACLSILRSPTCLRLEDGTFYGWEGVGTTWGSCEGSCIHVWNYAQAAAFLFPGLERSMQESHLKYSVDPSGGAHFRLFLPLGIRADENWFRPCADGQFGMIMRCYRDWKLSGDRAWLETWYPTLKKMMCYTWSEENRDLWDPAQSGVLTGRQHHTLDMQLFGPNAWLTGFYLGALLAMSKMADELADTTFADLCREIFRRGKETAEKELYNGSYYIQKIDLTDKSLLTPWDDAIQTYWNEEAGEIKYQIAEGCAIDALLGQLYANFYGIGDVFDPDRVQSALSATFRYNVIRNVRNSINPWRTYAVNDEGGSCICTWRDGKKPAIPIPYNTEMMNGFEWAFATHLLLTGRNEEAAEVAALIRDRYDGRRRNPWNEFECGSNYARSMAAFGMIPSSVRFRFDMTPSQRYLGFTLPEGQKDFCCFWSIGRAWGRITQGTLYVDHGTLALDHLEINGNNIPLGRELSAGEEFHFSKK